jgi:hypothetical protein
MNPTTHKQVPATKKRKELIETGLMSADMIGTVTRDKRLA